MKTKCDIELLAKEYQKTFEPVNGKSITEYSFEAGFRKCMEMYDQQLSKLESENDLLNKELRDAYLEGFENGWERKEGGVSSFGISEDLADKYVNR